jgi:hypothetical protein
MLNEYKYLEFVQVPNPGKKTSIWECRSRSSKTVLGIVKWYSGWRQYCFFPEPYIEAVYSDGCLKDIAHFISQLIHVD